MKSLLNSAFALVLLSGLFILTTFNTCQINQLESRLLESQALLHDLAKGGFVAGAGGHGAAGQGAHVAGTAGAFGSAEQQAAEREALADPTNLLKPNPRPLVDEPAANTDGTLRVRFGQDPPGLHPYTSTNAADVSELNRYVTNRLATRQKDNPDVWSPELAIKVTTPDNGLTFDITLRKGVMWHAPTVDWASKRYEWLRGDHELTSDDYAFVFDIIQNPQVSGRVSSLRSYFESFAGYEIIDRYHFRVKFKEKLFTNFSTVLDLEPLPRWLYMFDEDGKQFEASTWGIKINSHWYNQKAIGVGPYAFVDWTPGVKIELARNERYWGEPPAFKRLLIKIIKDQNAWPRQLKTKELDMTSLQPEQYRTEVQEAKGPILGDPHIKMAMMPSLSYYYIGWNQDTPYFHDKRVRQAMTLALNRQKILANVFYGLGEISTGPFAQQSSCYDRSIAPWPFDLKEAANKLEQAGWKDTDGDGIRDKVIKGEKVPFEFTMLLYGSSNEWQTVANIFREDLLQIGVRLNPRALEWSTMLKKMEEREFDAYSGGWVLGWDVDLYQLWHSSEADRPQSSNRIGFRNKDADKVIESLRREFRIPERTALCHAFHKLAHDEQPYTFLFQRKAPVLYWDYLNTPEFSLDYPYLDLRYQSFRVAPESKS